MMYGYKCEYCEGTVQPRIVEREAFKHKKAFVILENVTVGVCDVCGNRYYSADILHTVHEIATGKRKPERTEMIPVAHQPPIRRQKSSHTYKLRERPIWGTRQMQDEDIDLSDIPEITAEQMARATLHVGGKPVSKEEVRAEIEFDQKLREIDVNHPDWRPFLCQGHPFATQVFIVGRRPANPGLYNWRHYWDPITGFDFRRFHRDKWDKQDEETGTYERFRLFIEEGLGWDMTAESGWLITNLYSVATHGEDKGGTKHLKLLVDYCKPGHIVVCSMPAWRKLRKIFQPGGEKGETLDIPKKKFTTVRLNDTNFHVSYHPASQDNSGPENDEFKALGEQIRQELD